ncbi:glutathionylspermidine synthase family protein [Microvirga sp. W0021]|uniref:Glutathionylspermidine synthase family protein n=1 Tax=Hohaiivirga grylli TaxID=3133970 RepID=A0ABV0BKB8_9HYPH
MQRIKVKERPNWRKSAEESGFKYHTIDNLPYWDETAYYAFTLKEIEEQLEYPSQELHQMALDIVARAVRDEEILKRLSIPQTAWDAIASSYNRGDRSLYGRFDFAYDGNGPAKLLEYNADTPTALYEAACFQWSWLEELMASGTLPADADQFNSIHDRLIAALSSIAAGKTFHVSCMSESEEDMGTASYIQDCGKLAGLTTEFVDIQDIGLLTDGYFCDQNATPIELIFKLYPWEWMLGDSYAANLGDTPTRFLEPCWKAILSNKGILPLLWDMAPDHPNLLPAFFEDDREKWALGTSFARKPLFSREGANIMLMKDGAVIDRADGAYGGEGYIRQALANIPCIDGNYPVIGSWIIADEAAGIGVREDTTPITKNDSRFLPHAIIG